MRTMLTFEFPLEPYNSFIRDGTLSDKLNSVIDHIQPESIYFHTPGGSRGGFLVVDIPHASKIPSVAEPLFLIFNARVEMQACMTMEDLKMAGLKEIGGAWNLAGWG